MKRKSPQTTKSDPCEICGTLSIYTRSKRCVACTLAAAAERKRQERIKLTPEARAMKHVRYEDASMRGGVI